MTQDAAHFRLAKSRKLRLRTAPRKSTGYVRQGDEVDCTGRERRRANVKIVASEPTLGATAYVGGGGAGVQSRSPAAG